MQMEEADAHHNSCWAAHLPLEIRALPHVIKLVNEFALSVEEAAREAAATGQMKWLKTLLPRLVGYKEDLCLRFIEIGAANGHCDVIRTTHDWCGKPNFYLSEKKYQPLTEAVAGGHREATILLLKLLVWNVDKAMKKALDTKQQEMVELLCEFAHHRQTLPWMIKSGNLAGLKIVYPKCGPSDVRAMCRGVTTAIECGYLPVIKFLHEKPCWYQYEEYYYGDDDAWPLGTAIRSGQLEIAKYLYDNDRHRQSLLQVALSTAAALDHAEMVEHFCDVGEYDDLLLEKALVSAAESGSVNVMKSLQAKGVSKHSSFDKAFVHAAGNSQIEAARYLLSIEGYRPTSTSEAFSAAAAGGHLGMLKLLDDEEQIPPSRVINTFKWVSTSRSSKCRDHKRVEVLKFLYDKGDISSEVINQVFPRAAERRSATVVKFLLSLPR